MKRSTVRWAAFIVVIACVAAALLVWLNPGAIKTLFCNPAEAVSQHLLDAGFKEGTFIVNPTIQLTDADEASQRGDGAFSRDGVYSGEALASFLASTDPLAAQAQVVVNERLGDRKVNWVPVYFLTAVNIEGNLGVENGAIVDFGTRESGAGELIWFPVNQADCTVVDGLIIRAGCANPGTRVVPDCIETECLVCPPNLPYGGWDDELNMLVCKDTPLQDPEPQGNNKPGGGGLAPPQGDPLGPPAGGDPPTTYTPAPTPTPTVAPTLTPDPTPAPTPEASQPPRAECSPAPGKICP